MPLVTGVRRVVSKLRTSKTEEIIMDFFMSKSPIQPMGTMSSHILTSVKGDQIFQHLQQNALFVSVLLQGPFCWRERETVDPWRVNLGDVWETQIVHEWQTGTWVTAIVIQKTHVHFEDNVGTILRK